MSSHREAPEISKDPVADSTDLYAFVSPDAPEHRHDHRQLRAAAGPGRRPELLRVRRRRAVRDQHRQRQRRRRRHHVPVPVHDRDRDRRHVPLQRRADHLARLRQLEPPAVLFGDADRLGRRRAGTGAITTVTTTARRSRSSASNLPCPPCNVGPRSTPNYAALADVGDPDALRRHRRCSPGSGPRASTSTSDRSSTSARSGRSRARTSSRCRAARWR